MGRWRPPHPARTIPGPAPCPTGRPRFATVDLARAALTVAHADAQLTAAPCQACGGAHHQTTPPGHRAPDPRRQQ
ncbi:hypothetical protein SUDANB1_00428 [Streptomyces sp. enrichment culture]